jgi:hypothetical protein
MYEIGIGILKVPINEEYISMPILSITTWEPSINKIVDPGHAVGSE